MQYPLDSSRTPKIERLSVCDCKSIVSDSDLKEDIFPDIYGRNVALLAGCSKELWNEKYKSMWIFCVNHNIDRMIFVWDGEYYEKKVIPSLFKLEQGFRSEFMGTLISEYDIPMNILENKNSQSICLPTATSKRVPKITAENPSCVGIVQEKNLRCHLRISVPLEELSADHVSTYLSYASALGFQGCIFWVSKPKKLNLDTLNEGMEMYKHPCCQCMLETPDIDVFSFMDLIEKVSPKDNFAICINAKIIYDRGYEVYEHINILSNYVPVGLVILPIGGLPFDRRIVQWCTLKDVDVVAPIQH